MSTTGTIQRHPGEVWGPISVDSLGGLAAVPTLPTPRVGLALAGAAAAALLAGAIAADYGPRQTALYVVGVALGITLYHARFGFASAFRQLVAVGQGRALRAHLLMLATGSVLFAALLGYGRGIGGIALQPAVAPLAVGLLVGAFLFGVGMQMGGACASGTLFSLGGGQTPLLFTLLGFIIGSVLGAWHWAFWTGLPALPPVSLAASLGIFPALVVQLAAFALIALAALIVERRRRPPAPWRPPSTSGWARAVRGSWPLWAGAVGLALLNALTFAVKGSPWGITSAFTLWGSQAALGLGIPVDSWAYWSGKAAPLHASVLSDTTSVMDFGIILGAFVAAALSGTFQLHRRLPWRVLAASLLGGVLMGYGARLAYGCNIGAYFSGIVSFSLHGWIWGAMAIVGTYAGIALRPLFGMANPKPSDAVC